MNLNTVTCRLANKNNPFRVAEAKALICSSNHEASFLHPQQNLSALDEAQRLDHLIWLAEYEGEYIGWASLDASIFEDSNDAYITIMPTALYVKEPYRGKGIASLLTQQVAFDTAFFLQLELEYRSMEYFRTMRGLEGEMFNLHLEIESRTETDQDKALADAFARAMAYQLEQQTDEMPYLVQEAINI